MNSYHSKVKKLCQTAAQRKQIQNEKISAPFSLLNENLIESKKLTCALEKLEGRDRVGVVGEVTAVAGSAAAGAAIAGTVAGTFGASTLLGSTTLAGALGGVFVTATPVGWVLGSAVIAGTLGYGVIKLVRSGGKQDHLRASLRDKLTSRLKKLGTKNSSDCIRELELLLQEKIVSGAITPEAAQKVCTLVEQGRLELKLAIQRIRAINAD